MKVSIAAGLFLNFCLLHCAFSRVTRRSEGQTSIDRHRIAFSHLDDRNWVGESLFYVADKFPSAEHVRHFDGPRLVYMPNVFNGTDNVSACSRLLEYDLAVASTGQRGVSLVYVKIDRGELRMAITEFPQCNWCEFGFWPGAPIFYLELLDMVPYADGTYRFFFYVIGSQPPKTIERTYDSKADEGLGEGDSPYQVSESKARLSVLPLIRGSKGAGHLFIETTEKMVTVTLIDEQGKKTLLQSFPSSSPFDHSLEHDTIGLCYLAGGGVNCFQYDFRGNLRRESVVAVDRDAVLDLSMHNLACDRGFLLATTLEKDEAKRRAYETSARTGSIVGSVESFKKDRRVMGVDQTGELFAALDVEKFGCDYEPTTILRPRIFERGNGRYCLALICKDEQTVTKTAAMVVSERCFSMKLSFDWIRTAM